MSTDMATLTGAYAVNALVGDERAEFERHLSGCDDCRQEVRELRDAAARLGAAEATTPPEELKSRVLAEVAQTRQYPPHPGQASSTGRQVTRVSTRARWGTRFALAAAVVGIVLAGAMGIITLRSQQRLDDMNHQMTQASAQHAAMSRVLEAPDARMVSAKDNGMNGTTVLSHQASKAVFLGAGVDQLPPDRSYQLWFIGPGGPVSAGLLHADPSGHTTPLVAPMPADTAQMGVTVEPAGGSPQPTTQPMLQMTMPT